MSEMGKLVWAVVVIGFLVLSYRLNAETVYVDLERGADTNPGTELQPVKTISRSAVLVNSSSEPGPTTIKIKPGVYCITETVSFENSREYTKDKRLMIEATVLPDDPN